MNTLRLIVAREGYAYKLMTLMTARLADDLTRCANFLGAAICKNVLI